MRWVNSLNVEPHSEPGQTFNPLRVQPHKMVKHTQTIRRQFADRLFECVWPFSAVGTGRLKIELFGKK